MNLGTYYFIDGECQTNVIDAGGLVFGLYFPSVDSAHTLTYKAGKVTP